MSVVALRWSLALVCGMGALALLVRGHAEIAPGIAIALAGTELTAAALFVVPRTARLGALGLGGALVAAAALHVVRGEPPPPSFAVYAAAIWVVAAPCQRERVS